MSFLPSGSLQSSQGKRKIHHIMNTNVEEVECSERHRLGPPNPNLESTLGRSDRDLMAGGVGGIHIRQPV